MSFHGNCAKNAEHSRDSAVRNRHSRVAHHHSHPSNLRLESPLWTPRPGTRGALQDREPHSNSLDLKDFINHKFKQQPFHDTHTENSRDSSIRITIQPISQKGRQRARLQKFQHKLDHQKHRSDNPDSHSRWPYSGYNIIVTLSALAAVSVLILACVAPGIALRRRLEKDSVTTWAQI